MNGLNYEEVLSWMSFVNQDAFLLVWDLLPERFTLKDVGPKHNLSDSLNKPYFKDCCNTPLILIFAADNVFNVIACGSN